MKHDVITAFVEKTMPEKRPSKETLNHSGLIYLASGINPYENTQLAYLLAYEALGIDILNRVPSEKNARRRLSVGESLDIGRGYVCGHLGLYDTIYRARFPFVTEDDFFEAAENIKLDYHDMLNPVPHRLDLEMIKDKVRIAGDVGIYYYQYYNTLFMWGVEYLGWEVFMMAATLQPEEFDKKFMQVAFETSLRDIETLSNADCPFVFLHDDLAAKNGPVFSPEYYDSYILPRYPELWNPIKDKGKRVIVVADGDMGHFLPALYNMGADGVMLETPATDFERILDVFGERIVICGTDTGLLTFGTPQEIKQSVYDIAQKTKNIPGFAMCSPGGLHNNIPMENVIAYFDARVECGFTKRGWKKGSLEMAETLIP